MDSNFGGLVMRLKGLVSSVTAVLDEAEQRQIRDDPRVEAWLDKAQEAVFDAEGLLDEIEYDALRLKVTGDSGAGTSEVRQSKRPRVLDMIPFFRNTNESEREVKIKKILDLLVEIANQKDLLDVVENPAEEKRWQKPPSTCLLEESEIYGRDNDKEFLIELLFENRISEKIRVIPIVGMGGVGKTSLAQAVFNDSQVKEHFEIQLWVWVSEKFDVHKVISALLCSASSSSTHDSDDLILLQIKLRESLAGKKFLIVLDDVWNDNADDWQLMRRLFINGARGSRIIVTTRSHEVARIIFRPGLRATHESVGSSMSSVDELRNNDLSNSAKIYQRRELLPMWTKQLRVNSETNFPEKEDGFSWRKFGRKQSLNSKYPRIFFRCTLRVAENCLAVKQMQRLDEDPTLFNITYKGTHTCSQAGSFVQLQDQMPENNTTIIQNSLESDLRVMGTGTIYLNVLDEGASWQLFSKHAFDVNVNANPDLEKIGRKIVKKCRGLPLAVKTFGGLLRHKLDVDHWEEILETEIWELTDKQSDILPSLRLSYHYLSSHLKRCFAYCAIFPKNYLLEKEELISLWMAQNLLEQSGELGRIEEVGDRYFDKLVSISFIQPSSESKTQFMMHDLIVDLATFISSKYCSRLEDQIPINELKKKTTRHFACAKIDDIAYQRFNCILKPTLLRTFLDENAQKQSPCSASKTKLLDFFLNLKYLKALSFCGYHEGRELTDSIFELKHLRFLKISNLSIGRFPDSLCTLYNLQTLKFVRCDSLSQLPENIHHLISLRYLDASYSAIEELPESISMLSNLQKLNLQGCENLKHLPKDFHHLISLRYLDASRTSLEELPESLSQLSQLQYLDLFCCSKLKKLPENFHNLINLRYLNVKATNVRELGHLPILGASLFINDIRDLQNPEDPKDGKIGDELLDLDWTSLQEMSFTDDNLEQHTGTS